MKKRTIAFVSIAWMGLVTWSTPTRAEGDDVVQLRDGSSIKGTVIKQEPGKYVVIRTADGRETMLRFDDIKRVDTSAASATSTENATQTNTKVSKHELGLTVNTTFTDAEQRRQAWMKRGGLLATYEVHGSAMFLVVGPLSKLGKSSTGVGFGGGVGGRLGFINLSLPDPSTLASSWNSLRAGVGVDASGFALNPPESNEFYGTGFVAIPGYIGWEWGIGSYALDNQWKGVVLGLDYQPSLNLTFGSGYSSTQFSYTGFDVSLDFTTLQAALDKQTEEAHFRIALFLIPPVDNLPFLASLSFGAVWY